MKDWTNLKEDLAENCEKTFRDDMSGLSPEFLAMFDEPMSIEIKKLGTEAELASYLDRHMCMLIEKGYITQEIIDKHLPLFQHHGLPTNIEEYMASVEERRKMREASADLTDPQDIRRRWRQQLGDKLRYTRRVRGLTIRQAAELSGVDKNAISRIEAGRANATIDSIFALIEAYKADLIIDTSKREIR